MSSKKILVISKFCPFHPLAGGAEKFLYEILKRLKNHQIFYLTVRFPQSLPLENKENITFRRIGFPFSYNILTLNFVLPFIFKKYVKQIRPDLIIENIGSIPFFVPLLDFKNQYKKIIILHQFNRHFLITNKRYLFGFLSWLLEKIFLIFYKKEVIITVSNWLQEELRSNKFQKIYRLKCGINQKYFALHKNYSLQPTVLYLNRIEYRKGLDLLLQTYPLVKEKIPNVRYQIGGRFFSFGNKLFIKKIKKYLNLFPEIEFFDYVSEKRKMKLLSSCWLFINPARLEGYGISNVEANATGTFVIANNVLGLKESVKNNEAGILVNFENPYEAAKTIIEWLNVTKLKKQEEKCRHWAKYHNWEKTFQNFVKIIKNEFKFKL